MNGRQSKKLMREARKMARANWMEYYFAIKKWPWSVRLRFAWQILFTPVQRKVKRGK